MSVLKGLKGTIKGVQQDIVDGLKALASFETHPKAETLQRLHGDGINLDVGADLLYRYHQCWQEIDTHNKNNAKKGKVVDQQIGEIFKTWQKQAEVVETLEASMKELPNLLTVLTQLTETISSVKDDFRKVEEALDRLDDVCDEEELQTQMLTHTKQLLHYQQQKYSDVERVKVQLAQEHVKRVQEIEKDRNIKLQERHDVFDEAFSSDLSFYKQHGRTDMLRLPEIPKVSSLSEINIELDDGALNEFLASQTTTPVTDQITEVEFEVYHTEVKKDEEEEDESFIEDDYTRDYGNGETSLQDDLQTLQLKLSQDDISYKSTFDTDSVERENDVKINTDRGSHGDDKPAVKDLKKDANLLTEGAAVDSNPSNDAICDAKDQSNLSSDDATKVTGSQAKDQSELSLE